MLLQIHWASESKTLAQDVNDSKATIVSLQDELHKLRTQLIEQEQLQLKLSELDRVEQDAKQSRVLVATLQDEIQKIRCQPAKDQVTDLISSTKSLNLLTVNRCTRGYQSIHNRFITRRSATNARSRC